MSARGELPAWVDVGLIPLLNLLVALIVSGLVVIIIGENPLEAMWIMLKGAVGSIKGWGYLLYYATNFTFTGLAVAVAFHAGLFNIGGEGQAYIAGVGAAAVGLGLVFLPWPIVIPLAILACMAVGAFWAWIPGVLQAKRGSHIVITTIMFNFIASSVVGYLINYWFRPVGKMAVESREITGAYIMSFREVAREYFDYRLPSSPLNFTVFLAIVVAFLVWYLLWRTKLGYEIRALGANPAAAIYAGIKADRIIIITMAISGALAGLMAVNEILGAQHRLLLGFVQGAGFVGIAVALMGRSHPFGIVLSAMLFGLLYQGGTELSFAKPEINRDMVVVIQGLVILFMGALEHVFRPWLSALFFKPGED
ncbi:MAG: ABC transporter permease [Alphaproteobacteria bacterium]|nr:ABC transporter permease [Alphaproteobacteria bacterium]